ncbi:nuclease-related domain-containing protein [Lysinibacillus sp. 54212]|uniref:nuclease-related domain-containing protein n=1 Tax=Lysinibacillus sp. 54212 TaxID=3119829 RepID=UPI002FCBFE4F
MALWIVSIVSVIVIVLAVLIYLHDGTEFSQLTGYSFFDILTKEKANRLNKLMSRLKKVDGEHKLLVDLQVPIGNSTYSVDAVLIHESGIYVIDGVHINGWISGRENDIEWVQALHNNKYEKFTNPIMVNKRIIAVLHELLPEVSKDVFTSVALFNDGCSFQKIEIESTNIEVMKMQELKKWTTEIGGEVLSKEEIENVHHALEGNMSFKQLPKAQPSNNTVTN